MSLQLMIYFFLFNIFFYFSESGWIQQSKTELEFPNNIAFADSEFAVITGLFNIASTVNGGKTWTLSSIGQSYNYSNAQFVNSDTGFIWASQNRGLYKTTNRGLEWNRILSNIFLEDYYFLNARIGYFAERNGNINRTTDGGLTWVYIANNHHITPVSIEFADENNGLLIDQEGRGVSTTDGGKTWYDIFLSTGYGGKISYPDKTALYVASNTQSTGVLRKSTNQGMTWTSVYFYRAVFTDIEFVNALTGTVTGNNDLIIRTTDGGFSWNHQSNNTSLVSITGVDFINADTGWLINSSGVVFKTTNGGYGN